MAFANRMTNLLQKIENRLGTAPLHLPDTISKTNWADKVIIPDTLVTFSRYLPRSYNYMIDPKTHPKKNGYYILDEDSIEQGAIIIGIKDLNWRDFTQDSLTYYDNMGLGVYDYLQGSFAVSDIPMIQARADIMSLFNNGIYPVFEPPNKVRLETATSKDVSTGLGRFHLELFLTHREDLTTIMPTQMQIFEALAQADVALFLYRYLIHYEGLSTVYAEIDLKLSELENEASKREEIITKLEEGYVSAANQNQPIMITV